MKIIKPRQRSLAVLQNFLSSSFSSSTLQLGEKSTEPIEPYTYAEAIVEAIHEPILILDKALTILSANNAFFKTFKVNKKKTLGRNLVSLIERNPRIEILIKRLKHLTKQNTSFEEFEITYLFTNLGKRTLLMNAKRIFLGKQATDFILLGIEDITKRRQMEQQKDDFIGYVTHELKTPITTISAFLQILQGYHDKTGDKKSQFLLSKMGSQMERLTNLLNSFANVYKAQTGKLELKKSKVDLNKLIHEVVEAFQYTTSTHDLIVQGRITKPLRADKERIHEVLTNLIINAIKYSANADKVLIKLSETDKTVTVSVKDFGLGISSDEQQKVFERFFRVKGKKEHNIEGLGLGLYLVSEIIKLHKGRIWVESTPGEGSTFSFSLPVTTTSGTVHRDSHDHI